ncbi:AMP-binding protein [bacterium LRH843]|nr:AMP-binding protein [bacterium LRH843]
MDIIGYKTIPQLLKEKVDLYPEKTFLIFEDSSGIRESVTYSETWELLNRMRSVLKSKGIEKGDKVLLHIPNTLEFFYSWFAITSMGAVMVPTNILSTKDEMEYLVKHSEAKLIITEYEYREKFHYDDEKGLEMIFIRYKESEWEDISLDYLLSVSAVDEMMDHVTSDDIAAILYTSGTTSKPKGVLITHANYIFAGEVMSKMLKMSEDDRGFVVLPMFHGNGQYYLSMPLLTVGGSIAVTERFSASKYFKQASEMEATIGSLFAAPIKMILRKENNAVSDHRLRNIIFAQSVTKEQLSQFEASYHVPLLQIYGMTETIGTPLMNPVDGVRKNMSIGRPSIGYEVLLIDEEGHEVAQGEVGQIVVKGKQGRTLMKGYFNNEKATEETLKHDWLYTGDYGKIGQDGYFYFVDRMKDMIKRAGENIATSEVEAVINSHPSIADSAVIGVPDGIRDVAVKAFIIPKEGVSVSEKELIDYCAKRLAKFKVPEFVEIVKDFPRTSVGKIQKNELRHIRAN